jgi:sec-independent protein translocase protein TatC
MRARLRAIWRIITAPFRFIFWLLRLILGWIADIFRDFFALFRKNEEEDAPVIDAVGKALENPASILEHLNALRKHLFRATLVLLLASAITFTYAETILNILAQPIGGIQELTAVEMTESIGVFMRVSMLSGFTLALPYIAFELLLFAAPGLTRRERFFGVISIPLIALLFVVGMVFAYFILLPPAVTFLINFLFENNTRPESYYAFILALMFWLGVSFEFPLVVYVLVSMGFIRAQVLLAQSRIAIVIAALLAAAITPTVDIFNMLLVWIPLIAVYFIGVGLAFIAQRGRDRRASKE